MMKLSKYSLFFAVAMLTIFSSCKKEEEVDPCTNGFLDPGEDAPDCGGNCPPCDNTPVPFFTLKVNDSIVHMDTKELDFNGTNWVLSMANDSLSFNIDIGTNGAIGSYPISATFSSASFYGTSYPIQTDGSCAISEHDEANDLMSGYFQIKFSRSGFTDTLRISDGLFEFFSY
jgi:hypothetical protein